ncbi:MAG: helix-turn-helix domain-containing protein [Pseudomonadota bacterium]
MSVSVPRCGPVAQWKPETAHRLVLDHVATAFEVSLEDLWARSRKRHLVLPRQIAALILHERHLLSVGQIGKLLQRDHTTIFHSLRRARERIGKDPALAEKVRALRSKRCMTMQNAHVIDWLKHQRERRKIEVFDTADVSAEIVIAQSVRRVKRKNALAAGDRDALKRSAGSRALAAAIERAGGWPAERAA